LQWAIIVYGEGALIATPGEGVDKTVSTRQRGQHFTAKQDRGSRVKMAHGFGRHRTEGQHGSPEAGEDHHSVWPLRLLLGGGVLVVLAGSAMLLAVVFGRPTISLSPSGPGLVRVDLGGWWSEISGVTVSSGVKPVAFAREGADIVPSAGLAQGETVHVAATATPPGWLRWLLGGRVSTDQTVRTPSASPSVSLAVGSKPGTVPVSFNRPVSVVAYRVSGGPRRVVRLAAPSHVADLTVPSGAAAGTLQVSAAPWPWEHLATGLNTVTWFSAPRGAEPVALASPAPGATTATSNGSITLTFAEPVAKILGNVRPTVTPAITGRWSEPEPNTLVFTPTGFGFGPDTNVTVSFDRPVEVVGAGNAGAGSGTTTTAAASAYRFSVAPGSVLRLEQILAQLHYLPLKFVPAPGVKTPKTFAQEVATMAHPLPGSFTWTWASTPDSLRQQWVTGSANVLVKGALMAFDSAQGNYDGYDADPLTVTQLAGASTWDALLEAAVTGKVDPEPYSYVYVTQTLPETLTLWENGSVVLTSAANTGIPDRPTEDGTFPIYVRYTFNYMSGTNPDGSHYDDPVYWINYFNGGDAVHGFPRGSYGYPQSLGCVELPISTAEAAFDDLAIGDLVTVAN
jgi:lipoprotein-anchoring transpeptidase ErfK/SrfK